MALAKQCSRWTRSPAHSDMAGRDASTRRGETFMAVTGSDSCLSNAEVHALFRALPDVRYNQRRGESSRRIFILQVSESSRRRIDYPIVRQSYYLFVVRCNATPYYWCTVSEPLNASLAGTSSDSTVYTLYAHTIWHALPVALEREPDTAPVRMEGCVVHDVHSHTPDTDPAGPNHIHISKPLSAITSWGSQRQRC